MHMGFLAADADWPLVRRQLEEAFGVLQEDAVVHGDEWFNVPDRVDGLNVAVVAGKTYIADPRMVHTTWDDFTVGLSRSMSCTVAAGGAETVSGTYWFTAAQGGDLIRLHWNVTSTLTEPLDLGDPIPSEHRVGLDDQDGRGIVTAFGALGFLESALTAPSDGRRFLSTETKFPEQGELAAQLKAHHEAHQRPDANDWMKNIEVIPREGGGFDLRAKPSAPPGSRRSFVGRLFGRR